VEYYENEIIVGYFNVGKPLIITRVLNTDGEVIDGFFRFYLDGDVIFEMDVGDVVLMSDILRDNAKDLYTEMINGAVSLSQDNGLKDDNMYR